MLIRTLIVDDEPLARNRLNRLLSEISSIEVLAMADNGQQAIELVRTMQVDLVFLDINMPIKNGLQAATEIVTEQAKPPAIIFCTAYDEYAIEAFKTQAVAYLMKPISKETLQQAIDKATKLNQLQINHLLNANAEQDQTLVAIQQAGFIQNYALDDLLYFRAEKKHVVAGLRDGKEVVIDYTLKTLETEYPDYYLRIHRNCLVNKSCIRSLMRDEQGSYVLLNDTHQRFMVSRRHLAGVKRCFAILDSSG